MITEEPPILDESENGQPVKEESPSQEPSPVDIEVASIEKKVPTNSISQAYAAFMYHSRLYFDNLGLNKAKQKKTAFYVPVTDSQSDSFSQSDLFFHLTKNKLINELTEENSVFKIGETDNPITQILTQEAQAELTLTEQYLLLRQIAILRTTQDPLGDNKFAEKIKNDRGPFNKGFSDKVLAATWRKEEVFQREADKLNGFETHLYVYDSEHNEAWHLQNITKAMDLEEAHLYLLGQIYLLIQNPHNKSKYETRIIDGDKEELPLFHNENATKGIRFYAHEMAIEFIKNKKFELTRQGTRKQKAITYFTKNERQEAWRELSEEITSIYLLLNQSMPEKSLFGFTQKTKKNYDALAEAINGYLKLINEEVDVLISIFDPEREFRRENEMKTLEKNIGKLLQEVIREAAVAVGIDAHLSKKTLLQYDLSYAANVKAPIPQQLNASIQLLGNMFSLLCQIQPLIGSDRFKAYFDENVRETPDSYDYRQSFLEVFEFLVNPVIQQQVFSVNGNPIPESFDSFLDKNIPLKQYWNERAFIHIVQRLVGSPPNTIQQLANAIKKVLPQFNESSESAQMAARYVLALYGLESNVTLALPTEIWKINVPNIMSATKQLQDRVAEIKEDIETYANSNQVKLQDILNLPDDSDEKLSQLAAWLEQEDNKKWANNPESNKTERSKALSKYVASLKQVFWVLITTPSINVKLFDNRSLLSFCHAFFINGENFGRVTIPSNLLEKMKKIQKVFQVMGVVQEGSDLDIIVRAVDKLSTQPLNKAFLKETKIAVFVQNQYIRDLVKNPKYLENEIGKHIWQGQYNVSKPITQKKLIAIVYALTYLIYKGELNKEASKTKDLVVVIANFWAKVMIPSESSALPNDLASLLGEIKLEELYHDYQTIFSKKINDTNDGNFKDNFGELRVFTTEDRNEIERKFKPMLKNPSIILPDPKSSEIIVYQGIRFPKLTIQSKPVAPWSTQSVDVGQVSTDALLAAAPSEQCTMIINAIQRKVRSLSEDENSVSTLVVKLKNMMLEHLREARSNFLGQTDNISKLVITFAFLAEYFFTKIRRPEESAALRIIKKELFIFWDQFIRQPAQETNMPCLMLPKRISGFKIDETYEGGQIEGFKDAQVEYHRKLREIGNTNKKSEALFTANFGPASGRIHPLDKNFSVEAPFVIQEQSPISDSKAKDTDISIVLNQDPDKIVDQRTVSVVVKTAPDFEKRERSNSFGTPTNGQGIFDKKVMTRSKSEGDFFAHEMFAQETRSLSKF